LKSFRRKISVPLKSTAALETRLQEDVSSPPLLTAKPLSRIICRASACCRSLRQPLPHRQSASGKMGAGRPSLQRVGSNGEVLAVFVLGLMGTRTKLRIQRRNEVIEAIVIRREPVHLVLRIYQIPECTVFCWLSPHRSGKWDALKEQQKGDVLLAFLPPYSPEPQSR
jgi:hypothetical protein